MQAILTTVLSCLMAVATTLALPVNFPPISSPANWPQPSPIHHLMGTTGLRPAAPRISADESGHLLEKILDAQTLLYAMLIVAIEPKQDYVPIGHDGDYFADVMPSAFEDRRAVPYDAVVLPAVMAAIDGAVVMGNVGESDAADDDVPCDAEV